jgi:hypothetical protein
MSEKIIGKRFFTIEKIDMKIYKEKYNNGNSLHIIESKNQKFALITNEYRKIKQIINSEEFVLEKINKITLIYIRGYGL